MRKHILLATAAIIFVCFAFTLPLQLNQAKVKQVEGIYLFHFSEPVSDYKYLGTVKVPGMVWDNDPETFKKNLIKRCKKDYSTANGLIISDDYQKADAIMISE